MAAENHAAILDAVYPLLQEQSVRDLTMEAVAKRAGVGKPTLYKWWPTKAALVLAMYRERIVDARPEPVPSETAEETMRRAAVAIIRALQGLLGKVVVELIAEGQSEPNLALQSEKIRQGPVSPGFWRASDPREEHTAFRSRDLGAPVLCTRRNGVAPVGHP
jgi:AcrR family transcriptional regulator